ncbi:MAG: VCBS repeat-containing protein [Cyclobacteriaceae bacterium]|nr:VCBS repeat-containing protein [Cyclobacteriaceae bacterium]
MKRLSTPLILLLALATGAFAQFGPNQSVYSAGGGALMELVHTADLDKDGDMDVISKKWNSNYAMWFANNGQGTFSSGTQLPSSNIGKMVAIQTLDYDKDGDLDIVGAYQTGTVKLWTNFGFGAFTSTVNLSTTAATITALIPVDIDSDGDDDIAVSTNPDDAYYFENNSPAAWVKKSLNVGSTDYLAFFRTSPTNVDVYSASNSSNREIKKNGVTIGPSSGPYTIKFMKATDLDRDGDTDIVLMFGALGVYENLGTSFKYTVIENSQGISYRSVTVFDYDGDGDEDIFAGCWLDCGILLFANDGSGTFTKVGNVGGGAIQEHDLSNADINGDGKNDLVYNNGAWHEIFWLQNNQEQFQGILADFKVEGQCPEVPLQFRGTPRGKNITEWLWNFGDGSSSTAVAPTHQYALPGNYTVSLKVTNAAGQSHTLPKVVAVQSAPAMPNQTFKFCGTSGILKLDPAFEYEWFFPWSSTPYATGPEQEFSFPMTVHVTKTDPTTGCTTSPGVITVEKHSFPPLPITSNVTSHEGPADLLLTSGALGSDVNVWTNQEGDVLATGLSYLAFFEETTTVYCHSVNEAGCSGGRSPATAFIYPGPTPAPAFTWADPTQTNTFSEGHRMIKDKNSNYLVYGGWSDGLYKAGSFTLDGTAAGGDRFLTRYTADGTVLKAIHLLKNVSYYVYDHDVKLAVDHDNNTYITFGFSTEFTFLGHDIPATPSGSPQSYTFVGKISESGGYIWHKVIPNSSSLITYLPSGAAVLVEDTGALCFVRTLSTATGDVEGQFTVNDLGGFFSASSDDDGNIYFGGFGNLSKYSADGTFHWSKVIVNAFNPSITHIQFDSNQNPIISGFFSVTPGAEADILGERIGGGSGGYLAKLTPDGDLLWARRDVLILGVNDLEVDNQDNIFVMCRPGGNMTRLHKLDPNGRTLWFRNVNENDVQCVSPDDMGNAVIYGSFENALALDNITLYSATHSSTYVNYNVFIAKLGDGLKSDFVYKYACADTPMYFTSLSTEADGHPIVSWSWSFGDGGFSNQEHPNHTYVASGPFTVFLTVLDDLNNSRTSGKVVNVGTANPAPVIVSNNPTPCEGSEVELSVNAPYRTYLWSTGETTPSITVSSNGSYTISALATNYCQTPTSAAKAVTFSVRPPPATIAPTYAETCDDTPITLAVQGTFGSYLWNNGMTSQEISVNATGYRTVRVGSQPDCLGDPSDPVFVEFLSAPDATITVSGTTMQANEGDSYKWFRSGVLISETSQEIDVTVQGNYKVEVTYANGCTSISPEIPFLVNGLLQNRELIQAWPVPVKDRIYLSPVPVGTSVSATDVTGRILLSGFYSAAGIDASSLPTGVYILTVEGAGVSERIRIVKY